MVQTWLKHSLQIKVKLEISLKDSIKVQYSAFKLDRIAQFSIIRNFKYYHTKVRHDTILISMTFHTEVQKTKRQIRREVRIKVTFIF